MRISLDKLLRFFFLQLRFAASGFVATLVDYGIYLSLVHRVLPPVPSNIIAYTASVLVNFMLHRKFVFKMQRPGYQAFIGSMAVSAGGMAISSTIIFLLSTNPYLNEHQFITKLISTSIVFFYNFFFKRFVFEKRMFGVE